MVNYYGVSKRQWKKWNEQEQQVFNGLFAMMYDNQHLFIHPKTEFMTTSYWKTTAWNAAWMAADLLRIARRAK